MTNADAEQVFSVTAINASAAKLLENTYSSASVEGEISDLVKHRSGHWYFTLKDEDSILRAAMFRGQNQRVSFTPENGNKVVIRGRLTIYGARGSYQLVAAAMKPAGEGDLLRRFVELKAELEEQGWFDEALKKPLPSHPRQIAIVTSAQGAALRDMQTTFARRNPGISIILVPVNVQGATASSEIANAISRLNQLSLQPESPITPEAIIVGRGGGALEDLWAFNERNLALSIFNSELPVVSAVGHETDFTISDMVADARAATPTAAAEMLSRDRREILANIELLSRRLLRSTWEQHSHAKSALKHLAQRLRSPAHAVQEQAQKLDYLESQLSSLIRRTHSKQLNNTLQLTTKLRGNSPAAVLINRSHALKTNTKSMESGALQLLKDRHGTLQNLAGKLDTISPLATLSRGYTYTTNENQKVLSSTTEVKAGQTIITRFADGNIQSKISKIE